MPMPYTIFVHILFTSLSRANGTDMYVCMLTGQPKIRQRNVFEEIPDNAVAIYDTEHQYQAVLAWLLWLSDLQSDTPT